MQTLSKLFPLEPRKEFTKAQLTKGKEESENRNTVTQWGSLWKVAKLKLAVEKFDTS